MSEPRYPDSLKRALDLTVIVSAHFLLWPIWALLWLLIPVAIVLESGFPVFYRTKRVGRNHEMFEVLKFRTMVQDAEHLGPSITTANDDRITRVGSVLRKTGLDELPQLLAILRGDMSFVGPRAVGMKTYRLLAERFPEFPERQVVLPGLTGLATLYGEPDDFRQHLDLDFEYIRTRSLWLDIRVLVLSVWTSIRAGWESHKPSRNHFDEGESGQEAREAGKQDVTREPGAALLDVSHEPRKAQ